MEGVALFTATAAVRRGVDLKGHRQGPDSQELGLFSRELMFDFLSESAVF